MIDKMCMNNMDCNIDCYMDEYFHLASFTQMKRKRKRTGKEKERMQVTHFPDHHFSTRDFQEEKQNFVSKRKGGKEVRMKGGRKKEKRKERNAG